MAIVEARAPAKYPTLPAAGGHLSAWSFREGPQVSDRIRRMGPKPRSHRWKATAAAISRSDQTRGHGASEECGMPGRAPAEEAGGLRVLRLDLEPEPAIDSIERPGKLSRPE